MSTPGLFRPRSAVLVFFRKSENAVQILILTFTSFSKQGQAVGTVFSLLGIYGVVGVGVWLYDKPHKKPYVSFSSMQQNEGLVILHCR